MNAPWSVAFAAFLTDAWILSALLWAAYELLRRMAASAVVRYRFVRSALLIGVLLPLGWCALAGAMEAGGDRFGREIEVEDGASPAVLALAAGPRQWFHMPQVPRALLDGAAIGYVALVFGLWSLLARQAWRLAHLRTASAPVTVGYLNARVLLPEGFEHSVTPPEYALVRAHENTHAARRDPLWLLMARTIRCLLLLSPFTYLLERRLEQDMELSCDELVLKQNATSAKNYGLLLLALAERFAVNSGETSRVAWGEPAMARTFLIERIAAMRETKRSHGMLAAVLLMAGAAGGSALAAATSAEIVLAESVTAPAETDEDLVGLALNTDLTWAGGRVTEDELDLKIGLGKEQTIDSGDYKATVTVYAKDDGSYKVLLKYEATDGSGHREVLRFKVRAASGEVVVIRHDNTAPQRLIQKLQAKVTVTAP